VHECLVVAILNFYIYPIHTKRKDFQERLLAYEKIFAKYGKKEKLMLRATKEIDHY
jgi:hypothetical protein